MSQQRLTPTRAEECLTQRRSSKFKGGTIIAEEVLTLAEHLRLICNPDGYRPESCRNCGFTTLHVHDHLERRPRGVVAVVVVGIVRYICTECKATWRILPAFLARHLWSPWAVIENAAGEDLESVSESPIKAIIPAPMTGVATPKTTLRRWLFRLKSSARQLVVLLANKGIQSVKHVAEAVGLDGSRRDLVDSHAKNFSLGSGIKLASMGALSDRLERGIRLM
jgi:hypothetical protein